MTGLFHRLARQVVGPEPPRARSAARLPFTAPPAFDERQAEVPRPRAQPSSPPVREDEVPRHEAAHHELVGPRDQEPAAPPPRLMPAAETNATEPGEPPSAPADRVAATEETRMDAESIAPTPGETPPGPTPARADPAPPDASGPDAPEPHGEPAAQAPRPPAYPAPASPEASRPHPLLPAAAEPAQASRHAPAPGGPRAAPAGPPEVHVHIGRIDVASVSEPPPQRREPPPRRKPAMSLEDYLAKRKSGG